jgi:hypothetical protein
LALASMPRHTFDAMLAEAASRGFDKYAVGGKE